MSMIIYPLVVRKVDVEIMVPEYGGNARAGYSFKGQHYYIEIPRQTGDGTNKVLKRARQRVASDLIRREINLGQRGLHKVLKESGGLEKRKTRGDARRERRRKDGRW